MADFKFELVPVDQIPLAVKPSYSRKIVNSFLQGNSRICEVIVGERKAVYIANSLAVYIKRRKLPCKVVRRQNRIFLVKTGGKTCE